MPIWPECYDVTEIDWKMMTTGEQAPVPYLRKNATKRRLGAGGRIRVGYLAFFAVALLIFDAMILVSLLP